MASISCLQVLKNLRDYVQSPVLYFHGDEDFLIGKAVEKLIPEILAKPNDFNFARFYGDDAKPEDIVTSCETMAFGSPRRVVLVKRADLLNAADLEVLEGYVERASDQTSLIFWGGEKVDLRRKFFKSIDKKGGLIKAEKPKANELSGFIRSFAKARGNPVEDEAVDLLMQLTGSSLRELEQAVERLSLFVGPAKPITREAARHALADTHEGILWSLTDALGQKNVEAALLALKRILRQKDIGSPVLVLGTIAAFFRRLLYIRLAQDVNMNDNELCRLAGLSPGALYFNKAIAKRYSAAELKSALFTLQHADKQIKSSGMPAVLILQESLMGILGNYFDFAAGAAKR